MPRSPGVQTATRMISVPSLCALLVQAEVVGLPSGWLCRRPSCSDLSLARSYTAPKESVQPLNV